MGKLEKVIVENGITYVLGDDDIYYPDLQLPDSVKSYYSSCDAIITSLQKELDKENLSFDEKRYIIDKMIEVNKMKGEKDSENKRFIATLAVIGAAAIGTVAGVLASAIGGNTKIEMNDDEKLE